MRLAGRRLTGTEIGQLRDALLDAYTLQRLDEMLRIQLGRRREQIALGDDLGAIVFRVITAAEDESWTAELLQGARASRPENAPLLAFAQQFGLGPGVDIVRPDESLPAGATPRQRLERQIRKSNSMLDVAGWRTRLGQMEPRVCRVEVASGGMVDFGTGFLLGPDVLITNYHVLEKVITGQAPPGDVALRFDYQMMADGTTLNPGKVYRLAGDWRLDDSPYSPLDLRNDPGGAEPPADFLDYSLVRVAGAPGSEPVSGGAGADPNAPPRGFIDVPRAVPGMASGAALFILQHPSGAPLKLALDTDAVIGANRSGTRLRYRTNTEPGSSGSPCFDANWQLVALHHSGDPNYSALHHPEYNEGIPFAAILALLDARQKRGLLGAAAEL